MRSVNVNVQVFCECGAELSVPKLEYPTFGVRITAQPCRDCISESVSAGREQEHDRIKAALDSEPEYETAGEARMYDYIYGD